MKESTLLKIAFICSAVGLVALFLLSETIEIDETTLDKITFEQVDEYVKITGTVTDVIDTDSVTIVTVQQPLEKTAVLFKPDTRPTAIVTGQQIEVLGKVDEYNGDLEIIAHRARIIR